jgi:hypothetical protein
LNAVFEARSSPSYSTHTNVFKANLVAMASPLDFR